MDELTPFPHRSWSANTRRADDAASFRVGEVERSAACDALADHYAAGRLDPAELDDRLARAMAARTQGDLRAVFADLGPRRTVPTATRAEAAPAPPARSDAVIPVLASIMVVALLLAGGMLLVLGTYNPLLFVAALVGGTATGVAGACAVGMFRGMGARRS